MPVIASGIRNRHNAQKISPSYQHSTPMGHARHYTGRRCEAHSLTIDDPCLYARPGHNGSIATLHELEWHLANSRHLVTAVLAADLDETILVIEKFTDAACANNPIVFSFIDYCDARS